MDVVWNYDPHREETREDHDVHFLKVTNGTLKIFPRGRYRDAVIEVNKGRKENFLFSAQKAGHVLAYKACWTKLKISSQTSYKGRNKS